ncbi:MAG: hypothetical protein QM305_03715 [Bacteroidota bacterium]|nr:hypothetical protein [Bacteroidota bacterium]
MNRRVFLRNTSALTGGFLLKRHSSNLMGSPMHRADITTPTKIEKPFHGAILHKGLGEEINGMLKIKVEGEAPAGSPVVVNGVLAQRDGTRFVAEVMLYDTETDITAVSNGLFGKDQHTVRVLWHKKSFPRYGFEIDDNIYFLRDIARKRPKSLFDCFYLKGLRDIHKKYGTKVLLNLFYTDQSLYSDGTEFTLDQFPDRYKKEWADNADWLKLTFHAYAEFPDRPYQEAPVDKIISDIRQVSEQIHRFAGEETYTPPTIVHWGMANQQAFKPMYDLGVRVLRGYFTKNRHGVWDVNQNMDEIRSEYINRHDALKDFNSGIVFGKADMVLNNTPIDEIVPILESLKGDVLQSEIMDLMTHEQYFWPFYANYVPDHFDRLDRAIRWVTENGYKPVFWNDGLLGA